MEIFSIQGSGKRTRIRVHVIWGRDRIRLPQFGSGNSKGSGPGSGVFHLQCEENSITPATQSGKTLSSKIFIIDTASPFCYNTRRQTNRGNIATPAIVIANQQLRSQKAQPRYPKGSPQGSPTDAQ